MVYKVKGTEKIARLFEGWQETLIWSCIQNVMGSLYVDSTEKPGSAMAVSGDFCFFAGKPDEKLVAYKPAWCRQNFIIMTARQPEWLALIEKVYKEKAVTE